MLKVGQILKETRIKKGLTLSDVSQSTKIRNEFLEAIEAGEYQKIPSVTYAQGFARSYIKFLDLPEKETMALFKREFDEEGIYKVLPEGLARDEFSLKKLKFGNTTVYIVLIFIGLLSFLAFQYRGAFISPYLSVSKPKENSIIKTTDVEVIGKTDPDATLYVGNYPVSLDSNGNFKKIISVFPGKTEINIRSVNRFNKETIIKRHIEVTTP